MGDVDLMDPEMMEAIKSLFACPNKTDNNSEKNGFMLNQTKSCWTVEEEIVNNTFRKLMDVVNIYLTPVIIIIGMTGNLTSFLVFTLTHLRRQSSSVYLASLALADLGFLFCLSIIWLSWIKIPLFHRQVWCQAVVYITHVCTFLSVWFVVSFTTERYIIVWHPLRKDRLCSTKRATIVVACLSTVALLFYSYHTWTTGVYNIHSTLPICVPFPQYYNPLTVLTGLDSAISLILPSLLIAIMNIRIVLKIKKLSKSKQPTVRQWNYAVVLSSQPAAESVEKKNNLLEFHSVAGRLRRSSEIGSGAEVENRRNSSWASKPDSNPSVRVMHSKHAHSGTEKVPNNNNTGLAAPKSGEPSAPKRSQTKVRIIRTGNSQYRIARMLIIVSSVFVLLNLPSHVFRIHSFIQSSIDYNFNSSRGGVGWQGLFQLVYHLNFAINFFIYSVCGRHFRTGMHLLYARVRRKARQFLLARFQPNPEYNA